MKIYLRYQDDGVEGLCGQACSITNSWDVLHVFNSEDSAYLFTRNIEFIESRKNPRITMRWSEDYKNHPGEVVVHKNGKIVLPKLKG